MPFKRHIKYYRAADITFYDSHFYKIKGQKGIRENKWGLLYGKHAHYQDIYTSKSFTAPLTSGQAISDVI